MGVTPVWSAGFNMYSLFKHHQNFLTFFGTAQRITASMALKYGLCDKVVKSMQAVDGAKQFLKPYTQSGPPEG